MVAIIIAELLIAIKREPFVQSHIRLLVRFSAQLNFKAISVSASASLGPKVDRCSQE